jgi:hypothetical protein
MEDSLGRKVVARLAARLPLLILCLMLGIVCNALVAWGGCVWPTNAAKPGGMAASVGIVWPTTEGEAATGDRLRLAVAEGSVCDWFDAYVEVEASSSRNWAGLPEIWSESLRVMDFDGVGVESGWPWRSVYACAPDPALGSGTPRAGVLGAANLIGAWRIPWTDGTRVLPWRVLGWGTMGNLAVYSIGFLVLIAGPGTVRTMARRRGRRCEGCGYPVGGLMICPECGREVA